MSGKTILLRDKELSKWWASIAKDDRFEQVCALARAELFEACFSQERIEGANDVITVLAHFTDNESKGTDFPSPKLHHVMPQRKTIETTKP